MPELKIQRMVRCDAIKGIKFFQLVERDEVFYKRMHVVREFPQIDIDALDDPVKKFYQCFHNIPYSMVHSFIA